MALPVPSVERTPLHTRDIRTQVFERNDSLWDIEAELIDTKAYDFASAWGHTHTAGQPVHHLHLRITVDEHYTIVEAVAAYSAAPYRESCTRIADAYQQLVGMNLLKQFKRSVRRAFMKTAGCTHLTELCDILPTVAIQGMASRLAKRNAPSHTSTSSVTRPFHIDGCYALRSNGEIVKWRYPQWYMQAQHEQQQASDASKRSTTQLA